MNYTLNRSKRKTLALYVRDWGVEARVPLHMPKAEVDRFVASKEKWIASKQAILAERNSQRESFALAYGDRLAYRGAEYPIAEKDGGRIGFDNERFYMPPGLGPDQIKLASVQIYRMLAKRDLTKKALDFAKQMSVMPSAVKVNNATARWGSCSAKKSLNFSWRLIMADDDVIDYVVVHELAHIIELNHSDRFWSIVEAVLPDFRERKSRLKELQDRQNREDWG